MKSTARPHEVPAILSSLFFGKTFLFAGRKHFSLVTEPCHSDRLCLHADMISADMRQTVFVWHRRLCSGITGYDERDRLWLGNQEVGPLGRAFLFLPSPGQNSDKVAKDILV